IDEDARARFPAPAVDWLPTAQSTTALFLKDTPQIPTENGAKPRSKYATGIVAPVFDAAREIDRYTKEYVKNLSAQELEERSFYSAKIGGAIIGYSLDMGQADLNYFKLVNRALGPVTGLSPTDSPQDFLNKDPDKSYQLMNYANLRESLK